MKNVQNLVLILLSLYTVESIKLTPSKKKRPSPEALKEVQGEKTEWDYTKSPGHVLTPDDPNYTPDNFDQSQIFSYTTSIPSVCPELDLSHVSNAEFHRRLWILTSNTSCQRACKSFQGGEHWVGKYACDPFAHCGPEVTTCAPWSSLGCLNTAVRRATNNPSAYCADFDPAVVTVGPPSRLVDPSDAESNKDHGASRPFVDGTPCSMKVDAEKWCETTNHDFGTEFPTQTSNQREQTKMDSEGNPVQGYFVPMDYNPEMPGLPVMLAGNDGSGAQTYLSDGKIDVFVPGAQRCRARPDPNCHVCVSQTDGKADMCTFEHWSMTEEGHGFNRGDRVLCPCIERIPDGFYDEDPTQSHSNGPWWGGKSTTTTTTTVTSTTTTTTTLACNSCKVSCQANSCSGPSLTNEQFNNCIYSNGNIPCRQCFSCATLMTTCPSGDADHQTCMQTYFQADSYDDVCSCD